MCRTRAPRHLGSFLVCVLMTGGVRARAQQAKPDLHTYFREYIGLNADQIQSLRHGSPVSKTLPSRTRAEIFVFGAVYLNSTPEAYVKFSTDFERLGAAAGYLGIRRFSTPPQLADLKGFTLDDEEIASLKHCKPGDCEIQMPEASIQNVRTSMDWSAPDLAKQVNQQLQIRALERLRAYQQDGNTTLGIYKDKKEPTDVAAQFQYILSYSKALPKYLPAFYNYLLVYPRQKPAHVDDIFYWAKVKFGLKPTLRLVHVVTMCGTTLAGKPGCVMAEKQLYASHYFQTALDLTFCLPDSSDAKARGFYLIKIMGSEQAGLGGLKGSIVRKVAGDRSASTLQKSLVAIKGALETGR